MFHRIVREEKEEREERTERRVRAQKRGDRRGGEAGKTGAGGSFLLVSLRGRQQQPESKALTALVSNYCCGRKG